MRHHSGRRFGSEARTAQPTEPIPYRLTPKALVELYLIDRSWIRARPVPLRLEASQSETVNDDEAAVSTATDREKQLARWMATCPAGACVAAWRRLGHYMLADGERLWRESTTRARARHTWSAIQRDQVHDNLRPIVTLYERACRESDQWWKGGSRG